MSAWKLATRALYDAGTDATARQVGDGADLDTVAAAHALRDAVGLGLATSAGRRGGNPVNTWAITLLGRDWVEGRTEQVEVRPGGRRWVHTWLAVLPRCRTAPALFEPCCANERRSMRGGCLSCGDPCL